MAKKTKKTTRIVITGAQGTGKTTLMNALAKDGIKTLSIARESAIASGWSPERGSTEEYQKALFKALHKAISSKKSYISDRGLSCVAAYTSGACLEGFIPKKVAENQIIKLSKFHNENPDVLVVYVPIEFDLEEDGVRDTNAVVQSKIDFLIKNILDTAGVNYITVTGSVEDRVKQIENALASQKL